MTLPPQGVPLLLPNRWKHTHNASRDCGNAWPTFVNGGATCKRSFGRLAIKGGCGLICLRLHSEQLWRTLLTVDLKWGIQYINLSSFWTCPVLSCLSFLWQSKIRRRLRWWSWGTRCLTSYAMAASEVLPPTRRIWFSSKKGAKVIKRRLLQLVSQFQCWRFQVKTLVFFGQTWSTLALLPQFLELPVDRFSPWPFGLLLQFSMNLRT